VDGFSVGQDQLDDTNADILIEQNAQKFDQMGLDIHLKVCGSIGDSEAERFLAVANLLNIDEALTDCIDYSCVVLEWRGLWFIIDYFSFEDQRAEVTREKLNEFLAACVAFSTAAPCESKSEYDKQFNGGVDSKMSPELINYYAEIIRATVVNLKSILNSKKFATCHFYITYSN
jgi:hypothetical protein